MTATATTAHTAPKRGVPDSCEFHTTRVRAAMFDALGCESTTYAAAGISFEQDGGFTKAKCHGQTVVSLIGRFTKRSLLQSLRQNIADCSRQVVDNFFSHLHHHIKIPGGHSFAFDTDASLHEIQHRGARHVSAYVFQYPAGASVSSISLWVEIQLDLYTCKSSLLIHEPGHLKQGAGATSGMTVEIAGDTYRELSESVAFHFNKAAAQLSAQSEGAAQ